MNSTLPVSTELINIGDVLDRLENRIAGLDMNIDSIYAELKDLSHNIGIIKLQSNEIEMDTAALITNEIGIKKCSHRLRARLKRRD